MGMLAPALGAGNGRISLRYRAQRVELLVTIVTDVFIQRHRFTSLLLDPILPLFQEGVKS